MKKLNVIGKLSLLCAGVVLFHADARAETLMKLPPELRLARGQTDMGEVSLNAVVTQVSADKLPPPVLEEVKARVITYTKDAKAIANIAVYVWNSPWFNSAKLPPNYLISFAPLQNVPLNAKGARSPCNENGCPLFGYTYALDKVWRQDFEITAVSAEFVRVPVPRSKDYQLEIQTTSNKQKCTKDETSTKKGCLRRFLWRKFGLSPVAG